MAIAVAGFHHAVSPMMAMARQQMAATTAMATQSSQSSLVTVQSRQDIQ